MKIEENILEVLGHQLHHLTLLPESPSGQTLIFFHGQGDFIDRYPDILRPFTELGYKCLLTDLPGHGRSPGKRGHIAGLNVVDEIVTQSLCEIDGPVSLAGHSMGGLMALRLLLNNPGKFQNAWFSSPLLDPMHQAKPWMRKILPFFAPFFPSLTVSTGVKSEDCRDDVQDDSPDSPQLFHSRISLSWGLTLAGVADGVAENFDSLPPKTRILFTQGTEDRICPPGFLRSRLISLSHPSLSFEEIPGARHEPFAGSTGDILKEKVSHWLSQIPHS